MFKILITGEKSYIGESISSWLSNAPGKFSVHTLDMIGNSWQNVNFAEYEIIIHVAGLVHRKERKKCWALYEQVNTELPYKVAKKAKAEGVKRFIFFSTKGVYRPNTTLITQQTIPTPSKLYGKSKLLAEEKLISLNDDAFDVSILRPPTVYGEGCKGNFPKLKKLSNRIHFFPNVHNKRSMIYIWNLCEFVRCLVEHPISTEHVFFPQNAEYSGTLDILEALWQAKHEKYYLSNFGSRIVKLYLNIFPKGRFKTMFSDSVYDFSMSDYFDFRYCLFSFRDSIQRIRETDLKKD